MRSKLILRFFTLLCFFTGCTTNETKRPQTSLETGNIFIRATLDGDIEKARTLILDNEENRKMLEALSAFYEKLPEGKKKNLKTRSYQINKYEDLNDSTTIINYSCELLPKPMEIKMIRIKGLWYADIKYSIPGDLPID